MSDLISRHAAIEAIRNIKAIKGTSDDKILLIDKAEAQTELMMLPSTQPKPRWIPCSEKLPENGHYYLWCSDGGNVQSDYYWDGFEKGKKFGYNIIAWMPLPEPYMGTRSDTSDRRKD